jgi:hypothetical protein
LFLFFLQDDADWFLWIVSSRSRLVWSDKQYWVQQHHKTIILRISWRRRTPSLLPTSGSKRDHQCKDVHCDSSHRSWKLRNG